MFVDVQPFPFFAAMSIDKFGFKRCINGWHVLAVECHDDSPAKFRCGFCHKPFSTAHALASHRAYLHKGLPMPAPAPAPAIDEQALIKKELGIHRGAILDEQYVWFVSSRRSLLRVVVVFSEPFYLPPEQGAPRTVLGAPRTVMKALRSVLGAPWATLGAPGAALKAPRTILGTSRTA